MKTNTKGTCSFLLSLLVFGSTLPAQVLSQADPIVLDRVVAVVGKNPILQSDIENQLIEMQTNRYSLPDNPRCYVLESQLVSKLLVAQAEIDSIEVTDDEVERMLENTLQSFVLQLGSEENLEKYFKKSMAQIKQDLFKPKKEQMIAEKMRGEITRGVSVTPSEVQKFYKKIPSEEVPLISDRLEIREIVLRPAISDSEIIRVQDKLKEYRERIIRGDADFRTLAALYSEDHLTSSRGGDLGMTPRSMLVPEYASVAFNLKPNDVSRVVKSEFGYHIIQLIERRGDMINTRHILLLPKPSLEQKMAVRNRLDSLAQVIRENRISFEEAAVRYSQETDTRSNGGLLMNHGESTNANPVNVNTTWFEPQELPREVLDAIRNLKVGEISKVIELQDSKNQTVYKILTIKSRKPAHKADLKQDYSYLQTLALRDKEQTLIQSWVERKQKSTYIRIDPDYVGCEFEHKGWVK